MRRSIRNAVAVLLALCSLAAAAATQTITFNSTSFPDFPNSFSDSGFTFAVTSNQVATGDQPYFQGWTGDGGSNGIKFASLTIATDTVTMKRSDNGNFVMVSLWVKNLTSNKTMTVEGRLGASTVKSFTVAANTAQTLNFASATIDQVRIVCAVDDSWAYAGVFDTFTFDVPNVAPTVGSLAGDTSTYTQGGAAVKLDRGTAATVTDPDSADFNGGNLTASIIANKWSAQDVLGIGNLGSITLAGTTVSDGGTAFGTVTSSGQGGNNLVVGFNANATPVRVQNLLRALVYSNSNNTNPDLGPRTVRVTVNDGDGSAPGNSDVTVKVAPSALGGSVQVVTFAGLDLSSPVASFVADGFSFTVSGGTQRYFQGSTSTPVPPGVEVGDTGLANLTVTIQRTDGSDFSPNSIILGNFDDNTAFGITSRNNGSTVQSLGLATGATQRVAFNGNAVDQIVITGQTGPTFLRMGLIDEFAINVANAAPLVGGLAGDTVTYTQAGAAVALDAGGNASVSDADSPDFNGGAVAVSIVGNKWAAQDQLGVGSIGPIGVSGGTVSHGGTAIGTVSGGSGGSDLIVALNANATPARVQDLLRALQYANGNTTNPDLAPRRVRVTVSDGDGAPPANNDVTVRVMPTPVPPGAQTVVDFATLSLSQPGPSTFDHQGYHFVLSGGTARYTQLYSDTDPLAPGVRALDTAPATLTWTVSRSDGASFNLHSLIAGNFDDNTALNLAAKKSGATVQTQTLAPGATQRVLFTGAPLVDQIVITGQTDPAFAAMAFIDEISIVPPPTAPTISASGGSASYGENAAPVPVDAALAVSDANNLWAAGDVRVQITAGAEASDRLSLCGAGAGLSGSNVVVGGITVGSINAASVSGGSALVVTFNANAVNASVQAVARAVCFDTPSEAPSTAVRTVGFTVHDDGGLAASATRPLGVVAVNDPPQISAPSGLTVVEDVSSVLAGISLSDADAGGGNLSLSLSVPAGTLDAASDAAVGVSGNHTSTLTLGGTLAALNAYLAAGKLSYLTAANANGNVSLGLSANDQGNSGGPAQVGTATVALAIDPRPDAELGVSVDDGRGFVSGGGTAHYQILVRNSAGDAISGVGLAVATSGNLSNFVWACSAVATACPAPVGTGLPNALVDLPGGASLLFLLDADVAALPEDPAVVSATLGVPAGVQDPTQADHAASDSDVVGLFRDGFD